MTGTVYEINQYRDLVAVHTSNGDYSIFEVLGEYSVEKGDQVKWEEDIEKGADLLVNITKGQTFWVYFHNHGVQGYQLDRELQMDSVCF